ncbi:lasso peptide biosynthesis B2 protein [Streptomyces sp. NPDC079020]|uniref:lasso peptide biosynthesis B2 protein n=1 Tax=Streptomyces sp. NPDC079020 TaxID=3365722 RepID=UPI0037CE86C2
MADIPLYACAPRYIRTIAFPHVLVLIDYRTGRVRCLLPKSAAHWQDAARSGHLTAMPLPLAAHLLHVGALRPTSKPVSWGPPVSAPAPAPSWGSAEHPAGLTRAARPFTTTAGAALAATWAIERAGSRKSVMNRLILALRASVCAARRPASPAEATEAVLSIRRSAWHAPVRTACLEESVAAVLLLSAHRLSVVWCHGIAADPVRLHAWVQTVDGGPVAEPPSTLDYTPALTIGARHQQHP